MRQGERINQLLGLRVAQPYYFRAGTWYHRLKEFPAALINKGGYVRFETEEEYCTTPGVNITSKNQVQVRPGISSLPSYRPFSAAEQTLVFENHAYPASMLPLLMKKLYVLSEK